MKRIGITRTQTNAPFYRGWFTKMDLGKDLEIVILDFDLPVETDLQNCDGIVLTGGVDIDPECYEGSAQYENMPAEFNRKRDDFESRVYTLARKKGLPVLGICRGMQLVNILEGGKLIQDLGRKGNGRHRKEDDNDKSHPVSIEDGSILSNIARNGLINSAHHQAIDEAALPDHLRVTARSEDGVAEALEYRNQEGRPFLLCVQWHPERMQDKDRNPLSYGIKSRFLSEVRGR